MPVFHMLAANGGLESWALKKSHHGLHGPSTSKLLVTWRIMRSPSLFWLSRALGSVPIHSHIAVTSLLALYHHTDRFVCLFIWLIVWLYVWFFICLFVHWFSTWYPKWCQKLHWPWSLVISAAASIKVMTLWCLKCLNEMLTCCVEHNRIQLRLYIYARCRLLLYVPFIWFSASMSDKSVTKLNTQSHIAAAVLYMCWMIHV